MIKELEVGTFIRVDNNDELTQLVKNKLTEFGYHEYHLRNDICNFIHVDAVTFSCMYSIPEKGKEMSIPDLMNKVITKRELELRKLLSILRKPLDRSEDRYNIIVGRLMELDKDFFLLPVVKDGSLLWTVCYTSRNANSGYSGSSIIDVLENTIQGELKRYSEKQ